MRRSLSLALLLLAATTSADSAERLVNPGDDDKRVAAALEPATKWKGVIRSDIGVTRRGTRIPCLITADDLDYFTPKRRVLLIGGLDGSKASVDAVLAFLKSFYTSDEAAPLRRTIALSAVPIANPDGWINGQGPENLSGGNPMVGYPPQGTAYNSPTAPEAHYLWRWIGMHAPDVVVVIGPRHELDTRPDSLNIQLNKAPPANVGTVRALKFLIDDNADTTNAISNFIQEYPRLIDNREDFEISPARIELQNRLKRTPTEVIGQLARKYGNQLNEVAYIPALALVGRVHYGELTDDPSQLADVERIVAPYFNGTKPSLPEKPSGSHLSGHLVFGELAEATGKKRYIELVQAAADLGFDEKGQPRPAMPFHSEMSDAVFMGCPILAQAGRLTGDDKYLRMAARHMRFMLKLNLRTDGLHRHSPLDDTAWGRGNGFPALGLALSLSEFPEDHPLRAELLDEFRLHIAALLPHQDPTGTWHQVIDRPESYREFTATCMIAFSMVRGVRNGWLDEATYSPAIEKAWKAILSRIAPDATLVDVCTGTGKQNSLRDYYDRTAILGHDDRGGAMALILATEYAAWRGEE